MVKSYMKAAVFAVLFMFLLGFVFPTVTSLITEKALPWQSEGQPIKIDGKIYGSYLLAQAFNSSIFFHPRPSAIDYNLSESGSSLYSLGNPKELNITEGYLNEFLKENPGINVSQIPSAMISVSDSGLDPDIPLAGALIQVNRVAIALNNSSGLSLSYVHSFLLSSINEDKVQNFPFFGSYYVNVVTLNVQIIEMLQEKTNFMLSH
ncbi:MAG: potassium-transporting ATPase subunit KdpC [Thermoplasmata archaeon]